MNKKLTKEEFPNPEDKPCPFCASRDIVCEQIGESWIVWCRNCECFGPNHLTWEKAIEMWNLRRPMDYVAHHINNALRILSS